MVAPPRFNYMGVDVAGQAAGFWSYTHKDDEQDGGRILRLASLIRDEYALLTGEELRVFIDRDSLGWGDEWRRRVDDSLDPSAFFIPVITPRYFTSVECRRELLRFAANATRLGVEQLLLPIYYVDVPDLAPDSDDEAMALVANTQYVDWRHLRLVDEASAEHRQRVNDAARRLMEIAEEVRSRPTVDPFVLLTSDPTGTGASDAGEADESEPSPGLMDILAEGEEALPRWQAAIEEFPGVLQELSDATVRATQGIAESDRKGKGFAGRLNIARQLARELGPVANRLQEVGQRYSANLRAVDPAVLLLIRLADDVVRSGEVSPDDLAAVNTYFEGLDNLVTASDQSVDSLRGLIASIGDNLTFSRDLNPVLKRLQVGLRNVIDGQSLIEEWRRRRHEVPPLA